MASTISTLLILVLSTIVLAMAKVHQELKEIKMSIYMHELTAGPNITDVPVAGIAGKLWFFTQFGTIYVNDDLLTEGPSRNSTPVGRAQGIAVTASVDGHNLLFLNTFVFTNKKYNGSTIEAHGGYKQFEPSTEVPVIAGTGKFRFAKGYVIFETYFYDLSSGYTIIRCNVTVQHF